jgi:hypothetical protein
MQRSCADANSTYRQKCWTNSGGPLVNSVLWGRPVIWMRGTSNLFCFSPCYLDTVGAPDVWGGCGGVTVLPLTAPTCLHEKSPPLFVAKKRSPQKTLWLIYNRRFGGAKNWFRSLLWGWMGIWLHIGNTCKLGTNYSECILYYIFPPNNWLLHSYQNQHWRCLCVHISFMITSSGFLY